MPNVSQVKALRQSAPIPRGMFSFELAHRNAIRLQLYLLPASVRLKRAWAVSALRGCGSIRLCPRVGGNSCQNVELQSGCEQSMSCKTVRSSADGGMRPRGSFVVRFLPLVGCDEVAVEIQSPSVERIISDRRAPVWAAKTNIGLHAGMHCRSFTSCSNSSIPVSERNAHSHKSAASAGVAFLARRCTSANVMKGGFSKPLGNFNPLLGNGFSINSCSRPEFQTVHSVRSPS